MTQNIAPVRNYVSVFLALIALTYVTTRVSEIDLGEWNIIAAISIAVVKGSLVVWFFMHLNHSNSLTRLFAGAGLFWLAIMLAFTLSDYGSRGWLPSARWW